MILDQWMKKHPEGKLQQLTSGTKPEIWTAHDVKGTPTLVFEDKAAGRNVKLVGLSTEAALEEALARLAARAGAGGISLDYTREEALTIDLSWEYPGLNGTMTIPKADIKEVRKLQKLDAQALKRLAEEKAKIKEELDAQNRELQAANEKRAEAAEKEAKRIRDEATESGSSTVADRVRKEAEDLAKGLELYKKYPPSEWGADRIKQMQNKSLGKIPLSLEEREFMDNYPLWDIARRYMERLEERKVESIKKEDGSTDKTEKKEETPPPSEEKKP